MKAILISEIVSRLRQRRNGRTEADMPLEEFLDSLYEQIKGGFEMTEYIDREKLLDELGESASHHAESGREYQLLLRDRNIVREQPTADVIERAEYEKVLEENKQLKHIISDKVDKDLKCAFEVKEVRSKIDKAIEEIEIYGDGFDGYIGRHDLASAVENCIKILKRNIGE